MALSDKEKKKLVQFYLKGGSRQEALKEFGLGNAELSGYSNRFKLYWSLLTDKRRHFYDTKSVPPKSPRRQQGRCRAWVKPADAPVENGKKGEPASKSMLTFIDSVKVPPVALDFSPESLAPHLFKARPYKPGDENI